MTKRRSTEGRLNQRRSIDSPSFETQTTSNPEPRKIEPVSPVGLLRIFSASRWKMRKTLGCAVISR